jgi:UDP-3-O-[3-hydroxymyristoyl] glucosamine N-acyltransferase
MDNPKYAEALAASQAGVCLVSKRFAARRARARDRPRDA